MAVRDYRRLAHFVHVVEAGSVRAAARRLRVSAPVVSCAVSDLEADLGLTLLRRDGRRLIATEAGRALFESAARMVSAAEEALGGQAVPAGKLEITLPTELAAVWLPSRLAAFERDHPRVSLVIHASDQVTDLVQSDCEVAMRARHIVGAGGEDAAIDRLPIVLVAAPRLVAKRAPLADHLARIPYIGFTPTVRHHLTAIRRDGGVERLAVRPRLHVNNGQVARELAKAGMGAALLLADAVRDDIAAGRLKRLGADLDFGHIAVRVLLRDALPSPAARAFVAALGGAA